MQRDFLATINRFLHNDLYTVYNQYKITVTSYPTRKHISRCTIFVDSDIPIPQSHLQSHCVCQSVKVEEQ